MIVDKTVPGAAAVNQKGKWDYLIGVGLACFIGLLNGSLSGKPPKVSEGIRCRQCLPHLSLCITIVLWTALFVLPIHVIGSLSRTAKPEMHARMLCVCSAI